MAGLEKPGGSDGQDAAAGRTLGDLERRPKPRLWLVKATVADGSGEQVELHPAPGAVPRCGRARSAGCGGFTLIELLVAMTILALIAVVAVSGLQMIGQAWARRQSASAALDRQARALDLLRREVGRALPLDWGDTKEHLVAFSGTEDHLRFVDAQGLYRAGDSLVIWEFAIENLGSGSRVLVRRAEVGRDGKAFAALDEAPPRELFRAGQRLRFSYFGPPAPREPPVWQDDWAGEPRLPVAVRLAQEHDPETAGLVVRLLIDTAASCIGASGASPQCG